MSYIKDALVKFFVIIHNLVANVITNPNYSYGLAIILVTIVIKFILLPLNIKSMRSTIRMSKIQPEVEKVQKKYKNDPQRAQQELMKLYKEKGVSPLG